MDADDSIPATPVNPNNFPAKLWRLVNNPCYLSIFWDTRGEGIIIDQQLFETELLSASKSINENSELFKTTNFTSFIRQLNLYGFRKVVMGVDGHSGHRHPKGNPCVGDGQVHYFHNAYFRKDRPDLLLNMKRLTSTNKAKLAAGLEVNSRPPSRLQRLLNSSMEQSKMEKQSTGMEPYRFTSNMALAPRPPKGPMTIGHMHHSCQRENPSPYPYLGPASRGHIPFPLPGMDHTSLSSRTWPNSLGLLPGPVESPSSFPEQGLMFPVLQRLATEAPYALQPSSTPVHVRQGPANIPGGVQNYGGYGHPLPPYPQPYYPAAFLQYSSSAAHLEHLAGCSSTAVSSYQHCSYFQSPRMQSSYPMDFLPPFWPAGDSNVLKKDDVNLDAVFQTVDELPSSPKVDTVKMDTQETQDRPSSLPIKHPNELNTRDSSSQTNQLFLTPVNANIPSYVAADQSIRFPLSEPSDNSNPHQGLQKEANPRVFPSPFNVLDPNISVKLEKDEDQTAEISAEQNEPELHVHPLQELSQRLPTRSVCGGSCPAFPRQLAEEEGSPHPGIPLVFAVCWMGEKPQGPAVWITGRDWLSSLATPGLMYLCMFSSTHRSPAASH
ncbi:heat shock factor protein 5 [Spea bombifrons]|uniref:heat shock factor protein 5 n=1 Tax=Spea bombifrons TaxID=233779 RepID=UPI002349895C|nr:heat shock factor protein 5 [Spea bombifrons]